MNSISVVVTTCIATDRLPKLLTALCTQSVRPSEVLVVDNRPATSGVRTVVQRLGLPLVRYVAEARPGLSRARNAGLATATGDLVAFTDDDVEPDPDWLAMLSAPFADESVACVTGLIRPIRVETDAERWFEEFGGHTKSVGFRRFTLESAQQGGLYPYRVGQFGSGANAAFRRSVLLALGGFETSLGAGTLARGGEDLDIFLSVLRAGHTLVYQPAAQIAHESYADYVQLRKQLFGYGVGLSAALTKRFVTCREDRRAMPRNGVAALRYLLSAKSPKNQTRSAAYPKLLVAVELAGVMLGPFSYFGSRLAQLSTRR